MVDRQGKFVDGLGEFSNRYVKNYKDETDYVDVNVDICVKLKKENRAFKVEKYEHNYPHCWRTDKPVFILSAGCMVYQNHSSEGKDGGVERNHQLETKINRRRPIWQLAGKYGGLEPQPVSDSGVPACRSGERKMGQKRNASARSAN